MGDQVEECRRRQSSIRKEGEKKKKKRNTDKAELKESRNLEKKDERGGNTEGRKKSAEGRKQ